MVTRYFVAQTAPAKDSKAAKSSSAKTTTTAPSDSENRRCEAKGMVWVNTSSKIYHKEGKSYGKTNAVNSCLKTTPKKRDIAKRRQKPQRKRNQRQLTLNKNKFLDCSTADPKWLVGLGSMKGFWVASPSQA